MVSNVNSRAPLPPSYNPETLLDPSITLREGGRYVAKSWRYGTTAEGLSRGEAAWALLEALAPNPMAAREVRADLERRGYLD